MERLKGDYSNVRIDLPSFMKEFLVDVYPFLDCTYCSEIYMTFKIHVSSSDIRRMKITKISGKELDEKSQKISNFFHYYGKKLIFLNIEKPKPRVGKTW